MRAGGKGLGLHLPLFTLLTLSAEEPIDPVPYHIFRGYIRSCRKLIQPRLSSEAAKLLQEVF